MLFIAYTAGICNCLISTSTLIKKRKITLNKIIIIMLTRIEMYFMFLFFKMSSFMEIKTGISKTQL